MKALVIEYLSSYVQLKSHLNTSHSGGLRLKSSSLHVFLHGNISADDCARAIQSFSKSAMKKKLGFRFFCE